MNVILFGAGASYGCGGIEPKPPPLGADLFSVLRRLYDTWRSVPEECSSHFAKNFELGMAQVVEKYGFAVAPLMQEMAIFFSIFRPVSSIENLYRGLVNECADPSSILWSTLNYECIFELTAGTEGFSIAYFGEPEELPNKILGVWKLHGSCNFKVKSLEATRGVSFGTGVVFDGGIEPLDPGAVLSHYRSNTALYPAMALYAEGKDIAMSPSPVKAAQERWAEHVRKAEKMVVIGVHPNPSDLHIWKPIADCRGCVYYVGSENAFLQWSKKYREGESVFLGDTWPVSVESVKSLFSA